MPSRIVLGVFALAASLQWLSFAEAQYKLEKHDGGVRILEDGKLIADYATKNGPKPIIWPILGPNGEKMTRDFPMVQDSQDEKHDHPHHRSLWFTHGEVNGIDFWAEGEKMGKTEHQEFTKLSDGKTAVIATKNLWKSAAGETVLSDRRRFTFGSNAGSRYLDCEILLLASEGDLHFGDTKEGTFAVRVNEAIKVDAKKGGKIINSAGDVDGDAGASQRIGSTTMVPSAAIQLVSPSCAIPLRSIIPIAGMCERMACSLRIRLASLTFWARVK